MKNRKLLICLCVISVLVAIYFVTSTYGLFESETSLVIDESIAKWEIIVNDTNIVKNSHFTVDNINIVENDNVLDGKMAPGTLGYFDIVINPSLSDVSIRYDISFDFDDLLSGFTVENIEEINGNNLIRTDKNVYTGYILLDDVKDGVTNTVRVYIKWSNSDDNNEEDSVIGTTTDNSISIPITVNVMQYFGEVINEYNE